MMLVAVPVFGMTVVTMLVRTTDTSSRTRRSRSSSGSANLVADVDSPPPAGGWPAGTARRAPGTRVGTIGCSRPTARRASRRVTDLDLNDPTTHGAVLLRAGRFPPAAGEALVSPKIARAFDVGVGDELRLTEPAWTERIVGIGVTASELERRPPRRTRERARRQSPHHVRTGAAADARRPARAPVGATRWRKYLPPYFSAASYNANSTHARGR